MLLQTTIANSKFARVLIHLSRGSRKTKTPASRQKICPSIAKAKYKIIERRWQLFSEAKIVEFRGLLSTSLMQVECTDLSTHKLHTRYFKPSFFNNLQQTSSYIKCDFYRLVQLDEVNRLDAI